MDDDGPGWEMQEDNERQHWDEEQAALERIRKLTAAFKASNEEFERECYEHRMRLLN